MPAPLEIIVTNAGRAAIVNAQNTGTAPVTITQIGLSGTAVTPLPTSSALTGEFKRVAAIAGEVIADDTIHVTLTDTSGDAYSLRSIGLYLADGTLFAIYGQAAPVLEKTAQSIAALSIDVIFADIAAAALAFGDATFTNPPATTERQGVVELTTVAEAQAGVDALRALTPAAAKAAILGWLLSQDGSGSGLDADLLDGQDGSFYTNIPQRLGFTPVQQGGGVGHLVNTVKIGWSGTRLKATVDVSDQGNFVFDTHIADVWRASNDGAGSGLDADLLDGLQASQFLRNYNGTWVSSEEGTPRFHFINAGATYMRVTAAFIWQNSANGNVMSLDESGNGWLNGQVDAVRFLARANGDGQAVKIGDDAWIGDINKPNGFGIRGVQDSRAGFLYFGNAQFPLGCNPDDGTLRYNGAVIWNAGNDGAGSGLDADLVDGWHRDSIRDWNNLLNKPFNWSGQGGQPQWLWGSNDGNAYYVWNPANFSVNYANSAGNADTVDGYHASALLPTGNLEASGYCRLPNGLILQWGTVTCNPDSYGSVTFPIQFPTACFHIHSGVATEVGNGNAQANCPLPYAVTQSGANFWNAAPQATAWWMAVGK